MAEVAYINTTVIDSADDSVKADRLDNASTLGLSEEGHTHPISDIAELQTSLDGKASAVHSHGIPDITGLQTALDGKAPTSHNHVKANITDFAHGHPISEVTGLQTALDAKAASSHDHPLIYNGVSRTLQNTVTEIDNTKAELVHTHGIPDVTGLQTALDGKAPLSHDHNATYNGVSRTVQLTIDEIDNTKSDVGHTHVKANITDFAHTHGIPDITNLQTTLDGKAPTSHNHLKADITDFAHTHVEADITDLQDYALSNHDHNLIYNGVSRGLQATVDEIDATKSDIDHTHPGFENNFPPPRVLVVSNAAGAPSSYYSTIQAALNAAYNNGTHTANLVMVFDSGTAYNEKIVLKDQVDVMFMGEATLHPTTDTTTSPVIDANNVTCQIYGLNVEINHSAVCLNVAGSSNLKVFGAGYLTATNCITVKDSAKLNYEGIEINGTSAFMSSGLVQITCDQAGNLLVQAGTVEIDTKECGDIVVSGSGHLDMEFDYALNHSILVNEGARFDLKGGLWEVTGDNGVIPAHNDGTFRADCVKFKRDFTECIRIDSTTAVTILAHCTLYSASNLYTVTQALSGCSLTNLGSYFNKTVQVTTINVDTAIVDINVII